MKNKLLLFLLLFFFALQLVFSSIFLQSGESQPLDLVMVNEIVQSAAGQWEDLQNGEKFTVPSSSIEIDFTILSNDGTVVAMSREGLPTTIYDAIANRDTIVDIGEKTNRMGKLIIYNEFPVQIKTMQRNLWITFFVVSTVELSLLLVYLLYLNHHIFKPFRKLQTFAARVAGGDLDFQLEMDRNNVFGAFTESFDLMREELQKARILNQTANQSKKELVAKLSHDIKTPVASIQAVSELMEVSAATKKEQQQLVIIHSKANQIDNLISDLFHATMEELKELSVTPSEHGSNEICALISAADYQEKAKTETIPECMILYDKVRLQQVLDNIFSNSYKYSDSELKVSFSFFENYLSIAIEDYGAGVGDAELPLLFEKYYRGKNAEEKSGAGLGLFISRYLLEQMGGKISGRNTENGFCVTIFLKLA